MTNLYEFLRRLQRDSEGQPGCITLTPEEREWLGNFLLPPRAEIHFKSAETGRTLMDGQQELSMDYAVGGDSSDIYALLADAALRNAKFARALLEASIYIQGNVPLCFTCDRPHLNQLQGCPPDTWEFKPFTL